MHACYVRQQEEGEQCSEQGRERCRQLEHEIRRGSGNWWEKGLEGTWSEGARVRKCGRREEGAESAHDSGSVCGKS